MNEVSKDLVVSLIILWNLETTSNREVGHLRRVWEAERGVSWKRKAGGHARWKEQNIKKCTYASIRECGPNV